MAHLKVRPTKIRSERFSRRGADALGASGSGDFGVGGSGDWLDFLD